MAEKLKDAEDRLLASMFRSEPVADDGFSKRIVARIRRRIWVRRLALPVAMLVGGAIGIRPLSEIVLAATRLVTVMPQGMFDIPAAWVPQLQTLILGAILFAAAMLGVRMAEE